ncbi:MAG: CPBP family intramembrane metalloprotease [bacterium]|nr:CPBP family intramembrane metalloprotease [bacterium]
MIEITVLLQIVTGICVIFLLYQYYKKSNVPAGGYGTRYKTAKLVGQGSAGFVIGAVSIGLIWAAILLSKSGTIENNAELSFPSILLWFICYIVVAIEEEMVFRGFIMGVVRQSGRTKQEAILLSSLAFGFAHIGNQGFSIMAFANLTIFGISFALMYSITKSLAMCIGMHFSWNFVQAMLGFSVSGYAVPHIVNVNIVGSAFLNGGDFGPEAGIFTTVIAVIQIICLILYNKKKKLQSAR